MQRSILRQYHYLYKITNLINNKIYIGIHSTDRLDDKYLGSGHTFKRALKKYGKENFVKEILEWFDWRIEALQRESEIVNCKFINRCDTYNSKLGGDQGALGYKHSDKNKILFSKLQKGKTSPNKGNIYSSEARMKISLITKGRIPWNRGIEPPDETKRKIGDSQKGRPAWNKGIPMGEEQKLKVKLAKKGYGTGRKLSQETKDKMSLAKKGIKTGKPAWNKGTLMSEEHKESYKAYWDSLKGKTKSSEEI